MVNDSFIYSFRQNCNTLLWASSLKCSRLKPTASKTFCGHGLEEASFKM